MKANMFEELLESVRDGGAILRDEKPGSRRFAVPATSVSAIREGISRDSSCVSLLTPQTKPAR